MPNDIIDDTEDVLRAVQELRETNKTNVLDDPDAVEAQEQQAAQAKLDAMTDEEKAVYEKLSDEEKAVFVPEKLNTSDAPVVPEEAQKRIEELEKVAETQLETVEWASDLLTLLRPADKGGLGQPLAAVSRLLESEGYQGVLFTSRELLVNAFGEDAVSDAECVYAVDPNAATKAIVEHKKSKQVEDETAELKKKVETYEDKASVANLETAIETELQKVFGEEIGADNIKPKSELYKYAYGLLAKFFQNPATQKLDDNEVTEMAIQSIKYDVIKKHNEMKEKSTVKPAAAGTFKRNGSASGEETLLQKQERLQNERINRAFKMSERAR